MRQKLFILLSILFAVFLIVFFWWIQAVRPINPSDNNKILFTIKRGETARNIADKLKKQELIRSPVAFFIVARFSSFGNNIQAGDFRLSPSMDLYTLINNLTHGTSDVQILIIEGLRNEEIASILVKELNIPETEFLKNAKEGYMFPDTYFIPKEATAHEVVDIFLNNFNKKVNDDVQKKAKKRNLTLEELITIASLVEREAKNDQDRPLVASVILNRLKIGMKLDIDATVQYAIGYQPKEKTWWKKNLTQEDMIIDSLYNTYKYAGLPPSPISNPGLAVIKAVVDSPDSEYLYYLADKTGKTYFSKTFDEHSQKINIYLNN